MIVFRDDQGSDVYGHCSCCVAADRPFAGRCGVEAVRALVLVSVNGHPKPWRIVREGRMFQVLDANGRKLAVIWWQPPDGGMLGDYLTEQEALEMAKAVARLSKA